MGAKQLAYADEARQKLLTGVSKLARAVRCTLGPRGRNAVIDKGWGAPTVTKDGAKLAEAMKKVGAANGVITIEEGKTADTEVVVVQGMQFDRGFLSPHFVTNHETVKAELDNPYILIFVEKISNAKSLIPLLEEI